MHDEEREQVRQRAEVEERERMREEVARGALFGTAADARGSGRMWSHDADERFTAADLVANAYAIADAFLAERDRRREKAAASARPRVLCVPDLDAVKLKLLAAGLAERDVETTPAGEEPSKGYLVKALSPAGQAWIDQQ